MTITTAFNLRTMALLLHQGARLDRLSRGALLIAAAWLVASIVMSSLPNVPIVVALLASACAGLVQFCFALRVGFDAALFDALADAMPSHVDTAVSRSAASPGTASRAAAEMLDASLQSIGLLPASKAGRDWPARWAGASRLLRRQGLCLAVQLTALLIAVAMALWFPLATALSRTMPA